MILILKFNYQTLTSINGKLKVIIEPDSQFKKIAILVALPRAFELNNSENFNFDSIDFNF
jgi:hypothetical protein